MIRAQSLSVDLGGKTVLKPLSVNLARGRVTAIIGPNGAGKSSLMRALAGLIAPSRGKVTLDGDALGGLSAKERAQKIGYLPQNGAPAWAITVEDMVALGRLPYRSTFAGPSAADTASVEKALRDTDLLILANRRVDTLSGGELARAAFARVLAGESDWILADEPLANLDPAHQRDVLRLLRAAADGGKGVVVVLHELSAAAALADDLIILKSGQLHAAGPATSLLTDDILSDAFGLAVEVVSHKDQRVIIPRDALGGSASLAPKPPAA